MKQWVKLEYMYPPYLLLVTHIREAYKSGLSSEVDMFLVKEARVEELNDRQR